MFKPSAVDRQQMTLIFDLLCDLRAAMRVKLTLAKNGKTGLGPWVMLAGEVSGV